jgi:hypothetical protein
MVERRGVNLRKWNKKGMQNNYYYETEDGIPAGTDMEPNNFIEYKPETYKAGPLDASEFTLPSICNREKSCPLVSICTLVKHT